MIYTGAPLRVQASRVDGFRTGSGVVWNKSPCRNTSPRYLASSRNDDARPVASRRAGRRATGRSESPTAVGSGLPVFDSFRTGVGARRGRRRSAVIHHGQLSRENVGKMLAKCWPNVSKCGQTGPRGRPPRPPAGRARPARAARARRGSARAPRAPLIIITIIIIIIIVIVIIITIIITIITIIIAVQNTGD